LTVNSGDNGFNKQDFGTTRHRDVDDRPADVRWPAGIVFATARGEEL